CLRPTDHFTAGELTATSGDCDDTNAGVNPGATEVCNGIDDDCDGMTDEGVLTTFYADSDMDGFGDPANSTMTCTQPAGFVADNTDCDDTDANEHPGQVWYKDADGDGYSDGTSLTQCLRPTDHFTAGELTATSGDCDDTNAAVNPGATEVCNGIDDDCDGMTDETGAPATWYADADMDGFGDPAVTMVSCTQPAGFVADNTDCDDTDANEHPGQVWYKDADGDGYSDGTSLTQCLRPADHFTAGELTATSGDCDDTNAAVNPGATEVCNGIDDDCDGMTDETGAPATWYADADMDGFGDPAVTMVSCTQPAGFVADNTDCDDTDANEHPGQVWYKDADGDGYSDGTSLTQCLRPADHFTAGELTATSGDCNDANAAVNPGATEVCNGIDDDCDGMTDEGVLTTFYRDFDGDGFGDAADSQMACTQPMGYVANADDCDDANAAVNPNADEICDGIDNDCDGTIDINPVTGPVWFEDADMDGFGNAASSVVACAQPAGFVSNNLDCNDADANVNPNADEVCNGIDDDCDGDIDEFAIDAPTWYQDADGDGFGNLAVILVDCSQPMGYVANFDDCDDTDAAINPNTVWYVDFDGDGFGNPASSVTTCDPGPGFTLDNTDCNDNIAAIHPGAAELCNGVDDNCDGTIDEGCFCNITAIVVSNISACNSQGTVDPNDDTFTADVTVEFMNPPAGGTLELSGDGSASVGVGGLNGPSSHTFVAVEMAADDTPISLTANFSDDPACTFTNTNAGLAPSSCSVCSVTITNVSVVDESCPGYGDGSIIITAVGSAQLEYSIDGGVNYNLTGVYANLAPGTYNIVVRVLGVPTCSATQVVQVQAAPANALKTWYKDLDNDGYSDGISQQLCSQPAGYKLAGDLTATNGDCDDTDPQAFPGQAWYKDTDGDLYSDGTTLTQCLRPAGYFTAGELTATSGDCDDSDPAIHPGAPEICNGIDDDCDGMVDEGAAGGLTFVGNVTFYNQAQVDAFSECYSVIDGNLSITGSTIDSLAALINLEEVTGAVTIQFTGLPNLTGLDSLTTIGGTLTIYFNSQLTSLAGLQSVNSVGGSLLLYYNFVLTDCCPIHDLLNNGGIAGAKFIFFNSTGCNSEADINSACAGSSLLAPSTGGIPPATVSSFEGFKEISLFPNPADGFVNVVIMGSYEQGRLRAFDSFGRLVKAVRLEDNRAEVSIETTTWEEGIYLLQVELDGTFVTKKLVVK
ncbi:MAG TPA: T9SS type A sorting domain-containing protein, partial [Bacteroidetes bacterium]|nr:T9SS type A sorting domain-containing protein [Bacteroidota bacterium]